VRTCFEFEMVITRTEFGGFSPFIYKLISSNSILSVNANIKIYDLLSSDMMKNFLILSYLLVCENSNIILR
jgi:hypothetical protein